MAIAKKKKRFYKIQLPLIRKETELIALDIKELKNKHIKYDMTRLLKGKSMVLTFKTKFEGEELIAKPVESRLLPYYLKRMVRRGTNYIEDSFSTESKDSIIRIKPFLVTRKKVSRAVRKALRNKAKEELIIWAKENTSEVMFEDILRNKMQKELSLKLKEIYPLSLCEIRVLKVEKYLTEKK
ncbi:MAG: hypothetical protein U9Q99_01050 [Nanoarchaeota archaeon]|nr:hypothetical protein [Nanoarchaeota archaeon]